MLVYGSQQKGPWIRKDLSASGQAWEYQPWWQSLGQQSGLEGKHPDDSIIMQTMKALRAWVSSAFLKTPHPLFSLNKLLVTTW